MRHQFGLMVNALQVSDATMLPANHRPASDNYFLFFLFCISVQFKRILPSWFLLRPPHSPPHYLNSHKVLLLLSVFVLAVVLLLFVFRCQKLSLHFPTRRPHNRISHLTLSDLIPPRCPDFSLTSIVLPWA